MQLEKNSAKKAKTHTIYKTSKGRVPGVSTITGVLDKPALKFWANKLGLQGIEVTKYVDDLASIGSLAHYMVECRVRGVIEKQEIKPDLSDYTPNQIDQAENSFLKFLDWEEKNDIDYVGAEMQLVSENLQYGGTIDIYAEVNGKATLIDLKTCKAIFPEHWTQVAGGYAPLMIENGYILDDIRIVRIGRSEDEGTEAEDIQAPKVEAHQDRFRLCRNIYEVNKLINRK